MYIHMKNLPPEVESIDIRNFFRGLAIPNAGVHIASDEDAFIKFTNTQDILDATKMDDKILLGKRVQILLCTDDEKKAIIQEIRQKRLLQETADVQPDQLQQQLQQLHQLHKQQHTQLQHQQQQQAQQQQQQAQQQHQQAQQPHHKQQQQQQAQQQLHMQQQMQQQQQHTPYQQQQPQQIAFQQQAFQQQSQQHQPQQQKNQQSYYFALSNVTRETTVEDVRSLLGRIGTGISDNGIVLATFRTPPVVFVRVFDREHFRMAMSVGPIDMNGSYVAINKCGVEDYESHSRMVQKRSVEEQAAKLSLPDQLMQNVRKLNAELGQQQVLTALKSNQTAASVPNEPQAYNAPYNGQMYSTPKTVTMPPRPPPGSFHFQGQAPPGNFRHHRPPGNFPPRHPGNFQGHRPPPGNFQGHRPPPGNFPPRPRFTVPDFVSLTEEDAAMELELRMKAQRERRDSPRGNSAPYPPHRPGPPGMPGNYPRGQQQPTRDLTYENEFYVKVDQLPSKADIKWVRWFLNDCVIIENDISIVSFDGKALYAYVAVQDKIDVRKAIMKNSMRIGNDIVSVTSVSARKVQHDVKNLPHTLVMERGKSTINPPIETKKPAAMSVNYINFAPGDQMKILSQEVERPRPPRPTPPTRSEPKMAVFKPRPQPSPSPQPEKRPSTTEPTTNESPKKKVKFDESTLEPKRQGSHTTDLSEKELYSNVEMIEVEGLPLNKEEIRDEFLQWLKSNRVKVLGKLSYSKAKPRENDKHSCYSGHIQANGKINPTLPRVNLISGYVCKVTHNLQSIPHCHACRNFDCPSGNQCASFKPDQTSILIENKKTPKLQSADMSDPFMYQGYLYLSVQQAMGAVMARAMGQHDIASRITAAKNHNRFRELMLRFEKYSSFNWEKDNMEVLVDIYKAKYHQVPEFKKALTKTGDKILLYMSMRTSLGVGLDLAKKDWLMHVDPAFFPGLNLVGRALMRLRQEMLGVPFEDYIGTMKTRYLPFPKPICKKDGVGKKDGTEGKKDKAQGKAEVGEAKADVGQGKDGVGQAKADIGQAMAEISYIWNSGKADPKAQPEAKPKAQSIAEPKAQATTESKAESTDKSKAQPKAPESQPKVEAKPDAKASPKVDSHSEAIKGNPAPPTTSTPEPKPTNEEKPMTPEDAEKSDKTLLQLEGLPIGSGITVKAIVNWLESAPRNLKHVGPIKSWKRKLPPAKLFNVCLIKMEVEKPIDPTMPRHLFINGYACKAVHTLQAKGCIACRSPNCNPISCKGLSDNSDVFALDMGKTSILAPNDLFCPFQYGGVKQYSVSLALLWKMATDMGQNEIAEQIRSAVEPVKFGELMKKLNLFECLSWEYKNYQVLKELYLAKFDAAPLFQKALRDTESKVIVYQHSRPTLGTGLQPHPQKSSVKPEYLPGLNYVGKVLMQIRAEKYPEFKIPASVEKFIPVCHSMSGVNNSVTTVPELTASAVNSKEASKGPELTTSTVNSKGVSKVQELPTGTVNSKEVSDQTKKPTPEPTKMTVPDPIENKDPVPSVSEITKNIDSTDTAKGQGTESLKTTNGTESGQMVKMSVTSNAKSTQDGRNGEVTEKVDNPPKKESEALST